MQWLCYADKSAHQPRLRLKYVMIVIKYLRIWYFDISQMTLHQSSKFVITFRAFFATLYRCLARGARAVLQIYAENIHQHEMIMSYAMRSGFAGGMVVDWPHRYLDWKPYLMFITIIRFIFHIVTCCSSKARKAYLVLTCGSTSFISSLPKAKGVDGETCSDGDDSEDEKNHTVSPHWHPFFKKLLCS